MSTITKERIELFIKNPLENGLTRGEQMELARIALASLEAEPVAWLLSGGGAKNNVSFDSGNAYADPLREVTPLYTAPPAPVSVPAAMEIDDDFDSAFEHGKAVGWNAYRAAMLQAEPVSNSDELPLDYLQGHKDGLEWAAQLAEANHPQTGDWLYDDPIDLARAIRKGPDMPTVQAGNSPVTPDGWKLVPIVPTEKMVIEGFESEPDEFFSKSEVWEAYQKMSGCEQAAHRAKLCWAAMISAAPQQEVNRG
ncbi:putative phage protein [Escherichia coli]|nr:putative phage protein [Escherichia coli]